MAQRKAHEVSRFLQNPEKQFKTILIYGPNTGLVSEHARAFAASSSVDLDDPFSLIKLDADTAAGDANKVTENAHTIGMFGGSKLIWISGSTLKNLAKSISPVLSTPPEDAWVLIEAGDLKKTSPLRKLIEQSNSAIALPCYADDDRSINQLIDEEIKNANLTIEPAARDLLRSMIGADRQASRNEVKKLCLYAQGNDTITEDHVESIVGDASAFAIDEVLDAASTGDINLVQNTLARLLDTGTHPSVIANAAQRHFQSLHKARSEMDISRQAAQAVCSRMRPPMMFRRKNMVINALNIWDTASLSTALARLDKACFETRSNAELANSIIGMALMAISIDARRRQARN